ncbi:MAG TPA: AAA family ATPase [Candidatus Diapherotrites archaeon]|uniref:AAA family ATPase n=1 Tax=Candidatus Iainarchaeum sp. TaxID=3101447 RepID=A0A7J4IVF1_9ARCH|nr:AAA family ATPase [Candidatus Diapherotrites archaeon]
MLALICGFLQMIVIGVTGKYCAGKTTICEYLASKSFGYKSLSDELRSIVAKEGGSVSRESLIAKGNELRKKHGSSYLAKRVSESMKGDRNYIVDSLRNPLEIEELRKLSNFHLWNIEAGEKERFERILKRNREGDPKTMDEFRALEAKESSSGSDTSQQLDKCAAMAEHTIENGSTLAELFSKVDTLLLNIPLGFKRPSWDEYFMNIAKEVAMRSNCVKRKVGVVVVKDKRIVSTGYNGTPRNVKNCDEGGCARCNSFVEGGTRLDECRCSHAEENAIVQASYHGIAIKDSTIYTTYSPCLTCSKMIINAGIKRVVYNAEYPLGETALNMLREAGVETDKIGL